MSPKFIRMNLAEPKQFEWENARHLNATVPHSNEMNGIYKGYSNDKFFIRMLDDTMQRPLEYFNDSLDNTKLIRIALMPSEYYSHNT